MLFCIGIDLGTTFTCYGWIKKSDNLFAKMEEFPSVVKYTPESITVGIAATNKKDDKYYPLCDSKRFIGRLINDIGEFDFTAYPFSMVGINQKPHYEIGNNDYKSPEAVTEEILRFIYNISSENICAEQGFHIKDAVITVPANFSVNQRKATREAGEKAGFNVLRLINEPTAAAIAYCYDNTFGLDLNNKTILVYDFGGGTFDTAIIKVSEKDIYVLGTDGDDKLGGQDITKNMMDYVKEEINKQCSDIEWTDKRINKLRNECEDIKIKQVSLERDGFYEMEYDDEEYSVDITLANFNKMNEDLFKRSINVVRRAIESVKLKENDIDYIIMVGGTSRLQSLQKMLRNEFKLTKVLSDINTNYIVCEGASYFANDLIQNKNIYKIHDILSHSIGVEVANDKEDHIMFKVLKKGSQLPAQTTYTFFNGEQSSKAIIKIYEGENNNTKNNTRIDKIEVKIPKDKANTIAIDVTMFIDIDGVLKVTYTVNHTDTNKKSFKL